MHSLIEKIHPEILEKISKSPLLVESSNCHEKIEELLQKTVLMGGKRLRPLLTFLMADLFAMKRNEAGPLAWSIEYVHAASLAHDDVVDEANTRRGFPSINKVAGNKNSVLAGDYLLSSVIVNLTELGNLELVKEMAKIISDLAVGEWIQSDTAESRDYSEEIIARVAKNKTASVMSWCCVAPAIWQKQSDSVVSYAREFGFHLGMAFQLIDDVLDFSENSKKDFHLDLKNGIINSVLYKWLEYNPELFKSFKNGKEIADLFNEKYLSEAIADVNTQASHHLKNAKELLSVLGSELNSSEEVLEPLYFIVDYLGLRRN